MNYKELLSNESDLTIREFREELLKLELKSFREQILLTPDRGFRAVGKFVLKVLIREEQEKSIEEDPDLGKYASALNELDAEQAEKIAKMIRDRKIKDLEISKSLVKNLPLLRICKY